jgi:chorismate dehydratase
MIPKIGIVSYKNVAPIRYGLALHDINGDLRLIQEYPSALAKQLKNDELDIALVPVAFLKHNPEYKIISNYCIATNKTVASVCLFSHVPIEQIESIYLDYQSNTSVQLVQILCKRYWKISPQFIPAKEDYIEYIQGSTAGVIIGDRAFEQANNFKYVYDLGEAWHALTQLPFVFAVWVSKISFEPDFIELFENANAMGLTRIDEIVKSHAYPHYDLKTYFTQNIAYQLDDSKKMAMAQFLNWMD